MFFYINNTGQSQEMEYGKRSDAIPAYSDGDLADLPRTNLGNRETD